MVILSLIINAILYSKNFSWKYQFIIQGLGCKNIYPPFYVLFSTFFGTSDRQKTLFGGEWARAQSN